MIYSGAEALELPDQGSVYRSRDGLIYVGDAFELMSAIPPESVDLIVTSPPFPLLREKEYGNVSEEAYVRWFDDFAIEFKRVLKTSGSLVIDLGGAYLRGRPVRSIYQYEVLVRLVRTHGLRLAQEFFHYNPARLPTPAQWVTIDRIRVKDSVNVVWWLSKSDTPTANNRMVLQPYSPAMQMLLRNGYKAQMRPSGHDISDYFQKDNGGAIPPNLLSFANTQSNSHYLRRCRALGVRPHPARFPEELPSFFIRMMTKPGDVIFDPFAGSLTTCSAAAKLSRRWIASEMEPDYIRGGLLRFSDRTVISPLAFEVRRRASVAVQRWFASHTAKVPAVSMLSAS